MGASNLSFRVSDPDLSFIAANAAIEIDDLINGDSSDLESVALLSQKLRNTVGDGSDSATGNKSFIDPVSSDIFSRAFFTSHNFNISSIDDLYKKVGELADELSSLDSADQNLPNVIRDFCVALSKYSLSIDNHSDDRRNRFPNRR